MNMAGCEKRDMNARLSASAQEDQYGNKRRSVVSGPSRMHAQMSITRWPDAGFVTFDGGITLEKYVTYLTPLLENNSPNAVVEPSACSAKKFAEELRVPSK